MWQSVTLSLPYKFFFFNNKVAVEVGRRCMSCFRGKEIIKIGCLSLFLQAHPNQSVRSDR